MLDRSKSNIIETLISQASIDLEISHEGFKTIINEKEKCVEINKGIRMMKRSDELNKEGGKKIKTTML